MASAEPYNEVNVLLEKLCLQGVIRPIDQAFAEFIYQQESSATQEVRTCLSMLAAYVSQQTGEQHTCIELSQLGQPFMLSNEGYYFAEYQQLLAMFAESKTLDIVDTDASTDKFTKPLILDNNKLYLQRYWQYEVQLASIIRKKAARLREVDIVVASGLLADLFVDNPLDDGELDWQKLAVCLAANQSLSIITGGPGTGKTTTVTKLLALLQGLAKAKNNKLTIQLVAPTGKAAARLTESISSAKSRLPESLQQDLPEQCQTIHRLLGARPLSPYFKSNETSPLHLDVLVLDEASMVDLPLMTKLFSALPEHAQVVLLGDQEQLSSVETGSVLSDMCAATVNVTNGNRDISQYSQAMQQRLVTLMQMKSLATDPVVNTQQSVISDNLVTLVKSHRFGEHSGIGQLAKSIQAADYAATSKLLTSTDITDLSWYQLKQAKTVLTQQVVAEQILKQLIVKLIPLYKVYVKAINKGDVRLAFNCLHQQQVLCAQKNGFWGVNQINQLIEKELHKQGLIDNSRDFYAGRPIMLAKNDHPLKLFNGDIGIVMPDPQSNNLMKVWFITAEGQVRGLLPGRLPTHDTLYAMTIHKSQGSEFESVYLCLPLVTHNHGGRGLSRELLYTGLTRAKKSFVLFAQPKALSTCLLKQCIRSSGLAERLK